MTASRTTLDETKGGCLCGAVTFVARDVAPTFSVCHCPMCRRWTGTAFAEVSVKNENLTWQGAEHIETRATSDHAERAWCRVCGTTLYFKQTKKDKWFGSTDLALGLFDEAASFTFSHEIYADQACVRTADEGQKRLTRADVVAINPALEDTA